MKHVLSASQFSKNQLASLFKSADEMRKASKSPTARRKLIELHKGRILATLFYEPSTRTRLSFESAAQRLGVGVISTENAMGSSSSVKGESLEDGIKVVSSYADIVVIRHPEIGAAKRAASASNVPIINAGDGSGDHPTQTLLDLYTLKLEKGDISGKKIGLIGDLRHSRALQSLIYALSLYSVELYLFAAKEFQISNEIEAKLKQSKQKYHKLESFADTIDNLDIIYTNRMQKERHDGNNRTASLTNKLRLTPAVMKKVKKDAIILDPLPRVDEIDPEVDKDPRAAYFRQAENGLYIRMALIDKLLT